MGLVQFGQQWDRAMEGNDADEIGRFMAADWVIIGTDSGITSKEKFLNFIRSGDLLHHTMQFEEQKVDVYDNAAVVVSKGISAGTYCLEPFRLYEWATSVFLKKEGSWTCVLTMLTPANEANS